MECPVCLNEWSSLHCEPRMLPCGHSVCSHCLSLLIASQKLTCPCCCIDHPLQSLQQCAKNFALLSLVDVRKVQPKPSFVLNQQCSRHSSLVVGFSLLDSSQCCVKCCQDLKPGEFQIYQAAISHIQEQMQQTRNLIMFKKTQLQGIKEQDSPMVQLQAWFSQLDEVVAAIKVKKTQELEQALSNQRLLFQQEQQAVESELLKLDSHSQVLDSIQGHDDQMQVFMHEIVQDLNDKVVQSNLTVTEHSVNIKTETLSLKKLAKACSITLSSNLKSTVCIYCSEVECGCKKPLELFPNILHRPMQASISEIKALKNRRHHEKKYVNQAGQQGSYIISANWFQLWKCFVKNRVTSKTTALQRGLVNQSINAQIGILPPSQIANFELINSYETPNSPNYVKQGLAQNIDYIVVSKDVWTYLHNIYGGGPELQGNDIYNLQNRPTESSISVLGQKNIFKQQKNLKSVFDPLPDPEHQGENTGRAPKKSGINKLLFPLKQSIL